jgi:hypothetical protein
MGTYLLVFPIFGNGGRLLSAVVNNVCKVRKEDGRMKRHPRKTPVSRHLTATHIAVEENVEGKSPGKRFLVDFLRCLEGANEIMQAIF